jgi:hypothetical protein
MKPVAKDTTIYGCDSGHLTVIVGQHRLHRATSAYLAQQLRFRMVEHPWSLMPAPIQFLPGTACRFAETLPENVGAMIYSATCGAEARANGVIRFCSKALTRAFDLPVTLRRPAEAAYLLGGEQAAMELLKVRWSMLHLPTWIAIRPPSL